MLDLGDKYPRVNSLRQRVLDPALAEINKHTDLRVVMTPERKGRTVIGFYFDITQDDQIPLDLPEPAGNTVELRPPSPATSIPPPEEPAEEPIPYYGIEELQRREEAAIDAMIDKLLAKNGPLDQLTDAAEILSKLQPAFETLMPTAETLESAVDSLNRMVATLGGFAERIPRRRSSRSAVSPSCSRPRSRRSSTRPSTTSASRNSARGGAT